MKILPWLILIVCLNAGCATTTERNRHKKDDDSFMSKTSGPAHAPVVAVVSLSTR